jgi:DtxR family transcriptional regulator, manganese transport regulator
VTSIANPYSKTRGDHASETSEDYVEAILRLAGDGSSDSCDEAPKAKTTEIANHFGVAQPTVTKTLNRLAAEGLICIHRRQFVHLTAEGEEMARRSLKKHETIVEFLRKLGVSQAQSELDSEGMEHHISEETLAAFERFLSAD